MQQALDLWPLVSIFCSIANFVMVARLSYYVGKRDQQISQNQKDIEDLKEFIFQKPSTQKYRERQ